MGNREKIEKAVRENPGIGFQQLKRETGLSNGVLQYHIRESDEIERKKRALVADNSCEECGLRKRCGECCLRKVTRKPVNSKLLLLEEKDYNQSEMADRLDLHPSTVSYHMSKLRDLGVTESEEALKIAKEVVEV